MKALTVCQPYAELIARGGDVKPLENRTWFTSYRGPLLIHAGKSRDWLGPDDEEAALYAVDVTKIAFGAFVALGDLVACLELDSAWPKEYRHLQDHEHAEGPFCLVLARVRRLPKPVECRGMQGLWVPSPAIVSACLSQSKPDPLPVSPEEDRT